MIFEVELVVMMLITLKLLALLLVVWNVVRAFYSIWWKPKSLERHLKAQGIQGTPYKLLYGDLNEYGRLTMEACSKPMNLTHAIVPRVMPFILKATQTYGKICFLWFGTKPRIIISDPKLLKQILSDKFGQFQRPPAHPLHRYFILGLTSLDGEKWANHRRIINPAFNLEKLKGMMPSFSTSCLQLIERWKNIVGLQGYCELDIWQEFQNFSGDVISRTAFGSNFEAGKRIFELQKEQANLLIEAMQSIYVPGFRFIPTKKNRRRMKLYKEIKTILKALIHKKEQAIRNGESSSGDLLGILLQYNNQSYLQRDLTDHSQLNVLTTEELIEECKLFYFAGQETTAILLTWTMVVLAMHPSWQEKAREEVIQICGNKMPDIDSLNHLKIVTMVIYEVLRLYTPSVQLFRNTHKGMKIGDISLPAGVEILLPILLLHHDPELWGQDVKEFKPERFCEGVAKASKDQSAFFPFGWGPKICLGQNFAMLEAKLSLATILQHFSFRLSPSYVHAPSTIITLQPQYGAPIILHQF